MSNNIMPLKPQEDLSGNDLSTVSTHSIDSKKSKNTRKQYFSSWREKNREKIRNNWSSKNTDIECECGLTIKKYNKINHLKTKRHMEKLKEKK